MRYFLKLELCQSWQSTLLNRIWTVRIFRSGSLEIPFALSRLAETGDYDALIALGAVIRGETYHFEIVSDRSSEGIARVTADYGIPVANGVLTCENDEQCKARTAMKGKDCAQCAVEMARLAEQFPMDFPEDYEENDHE